MTITLPVNMVPLTGGAIKAGGFAMAVIIGLALYMAARNQQPPANNRR